MKQGHTHPAENAGQIHDNLCYICNACVVYLGVLYV